MVFVTVASNNFVSKICLLLLLLFLPPFFFYFRKDALLVWKLHVLNLDGQIKNTQNQTYSWRNQVKFLIQVNFHFIQVKLLLSAINLPPQIVLEGISKVNNISQFLEIVLTLPCHCRVTMLSAPAFNGVSWYLLSYSWSPRFWGYISYFIFKSTGL